MLSARLLGAGAALLAVTCANTRTFPPDDLTIPEWPLTGVAAPENPFLHAVGSDLVDGKGNKVVLKGIGFGNQVWENPSFPPTAHHGEADFRRVRELGMNAIRFYMNYGLFEDDARPFSYKQTGFAWLDQNIAWARQAGLYLVLNLHVPQGGFQSAGKGGALWENADNRQRFTALWREIANHYKHEPVIAGYDLLNEPVVAGPGRGWEALAKATVAEVRSVDGRHIIFIERTNAVLDTKSVPDWSENRNGDMNFFLVNDTNVVYEFHFYKPMQFTHQRASWVEGLRTVQTAYPGPFTDWGGAKRQADRDYLAAELAPYIAFGQRHRVPLFLGELGVIRFGFEPGRNGVGWASDMIDLTLANKVSFAWHCYHEIPFGLYGNDAAEPPAAFNQELADLFAKKLK